MATNLSDPIFHDEDAARAHFEAIRWPDGRVCPHCGTVGNSTLMQGKSTRPGLYKCKERECRKPFTATMGTIYERSHIPLHKWLLATHLIVSSKKGISAHQLYRQLGFGSYRTAWFMAMRIREAMAPEEISPFGSSGTPVQVDEAFIGRRKGVDAPKGGFKHKMKIVTMIDQATGAARSVNPEKLNPGHVANIVRANVAKAAILVTDDALHYKAVGREYAQHESLLHGNREYVRGEFTTNTVEGYFSIFKRGMRGIYQHCSEHHLHRYLSEFDFRYSHREAVGVNDAERAEKVVQGTIGKRLMLKKPQGTVYA